MKMSRKCTCNVKISVYVWMKFNISSSVYLLSRHMHTWTPHTVLLAILITLTSSTSLAKIMIINIPDLIEKSGS